MPDPKPIDFIRQIVKDDLAQGKKAGRLMSRFPPEPNGFLHIGHAKAICLNFGIANEYGGKCNLRFDDTNPEKESEDYTTAIQHDVRWLGFDWENLFYTSDYFEKLYAYAVKLIEKGKAYVCHLNAEQIREYRGTLTEPGKDSPYRERDAGENLSLFEQMRDGKLKEGECVLRAKIDMASPNINMRDPVIYRIMDTPHYRTGTRWKIYPTYDFSHCLSDEIEDITHSLCTLEFEDHRPLYDWLIEELGTNKPRQIEFARLQLTHTLTSKRKLKVLVDDQIVSGWDDPRMPTLSGMRRRGIPPKAIRDFCGRIGLTKNDSWIDVELLESCIRDELNDTAPRVMAVLKPVKLVIENYPAGQTEQLEAPVHPKKPELGTRQIEFSNTLYIDQEDFMETPVKKFHRLAPGKEVRLRYAYCITCREVIKDSSGNISELRCSYDPATGNGTAPEGRKVKGIIHWISDTEAVRAQVRLYEHLFLEENPATIEDPRLALNPNSLLTLDDCLIAPGLKEGPYQFERVGYFHADPDSTQDLTVFNRIITLRDSWKKETDGKINQT